MPKKTMPKRITKKTVARVESAARKTAKARVEKTAKTPAYTEAPLPFLPPLMMNVTFARRDDALPDEGPFTHKAFAVIGELGGYVNRFGEYTEPGVLIAIEGKVSRISRNDLLDAVLSGVYVNAVVQDQIDAQNVLTAFAVRLKNSLDSDSDEPATGEKATDEPATGENSPAPFADNGAPFEA